MTQTSSFKRERFVARMERDPETARIERVPEGSEGAQAYALALSQIASEEFLEVLFRHVAALNEFGGSVFIAAARAKLQDGELVAHNEPGAHETIGYAFAYDKRSNVKGAVDEPDVARGVAEYLPDQPAAGEPEPGVE